MFNIMKTFKGKGLLLLSLYEMLHLRCRVFRNKFGEVNSCFMLSIFDKKNSH